MTLSPVIPEDLETTLAEYKRLWPLLPSLQANIGKLAGKDAVRACAKRLQMLARRNGKQVLNFAHELELDVFQDYLLYMFRHRGLSLVRQMHNRHRYAPASDEQRLLEGMVQARFSIFWIKEVLPSGGIIGLDIIRGEEFFLLDLVLSQQEAVGILSGFRIFPYHNVWMHTGVNLVLGKIEDPAGLQPMGKVMNEEEERELNEDAIFRWRELLKETV